MTDNSKEMAAFIIKDRIHAAAKKMGGDMNKATQFVQARFVYERILSRLMRTSFADRWAIKGGVLMLTLPQSGHRMTMDLDWSVTQGPSMSITECLKQLCQMDSQPEDGIVFSLIEEGKDAPRLIRETADNPTVRAKLLATLCLPRPNDKHFVVDVTSAELPFEPQLITWQPTIKGFPDFKVTAYPWSLAFSEKLHAVLSGSMNNPRLRDYMDVIALARACEFDSEQLRQTLRDVFEKRESTRHLTLEGPALSDEFARNRQDDWAGTLNRTGYGDQIPASLADAILQIREIAQPLIEPSYHPSLR